MWLIFRNKQSATMILDSSKYLLWLLLLLTATSCINTAGEKSERKNIDSIEIMPEVVFDKADAKPIRFYVRSRGVVEAQQSLVITPRIGGFVLRHQIREGLAVQKGDTLLQFDDVEWQLRAQEAYHAMLQAEQQYEINLSGRNTETLTEKNDQLIQINSGFANAKVQYERSKLDLSYSAIVAPFSGEISSTIMLVPGSFVNAGRELGSLVSTDLVQIRFDVLESEIDQFAVGMQAEISSPTGSTFTGIVQALSPQVNSQNKTAQIIVRVDNKANLLRVGMTVEAEIITGTQQAKTRVPRDALLERDGKSLVFKYRGEKGDAEWIYVTPIAMNADWVLIDHPKIAEGDSIAVDKHFAISHQQKVRPVFKN